MSVPAVPRDQPYLHLLHDVAFRPVFIIGEHRSGTTILYKLLAATGLFNYVTYYHITHSNELLHNRICQQEAAAKEALQARFATLNLEDRGFDQIRVTPDTRRSTASSSSGALPCGTSPGWRGAIYHSS